MRDVLIGQSRLPLAAKALSLLAGVKIYPAIQMRKPAWATLMAIVLMAWACQEDDGKPANTLTFNSETSKLSGGSLTISEKRDGADYYHVTLYLYSPPWEGVPIARNSVRLWFTSATQDLTAGTYTIVTPAELNGNFKPALALPGSLNVGLSVDVADGSAIVKLYTLLKGSVQVKKLADTYLIDFQGEASTDVDHLPIQFTYTGKIAKDIR